MIKKINVSTRSREMGKKESEQRLKSGHIAARLFLSRACFVYGKLDSMKKIGQFAGISKFAKGNRNYSRPFPHSVDWRIRNASIFF